MMKRSFYLLFIIGLILNFESGFSQNPTYNLTAKNFQLGSINAPDDALFFDVYIEWTNSGVAPNFELAGSQLYFSFNKNVLDLSGNYWPDGGTPPGTSASPDSSRFSFKIVGSDLAINMIPRNNSIWTATSPSANVLRGAMNVFPGAGFGTDIPAGFPGTKICRYRLWNKTQCFNLNTLDIAWRNPPIVAFATKIFAYVGTSNTEITTSATHSIDFANDPFGCNIPPVILLHPPNNVTGLSVNVNFMWSKYNYANNYILKISTDQNFNSVIFVDSTLIDTFRTVTGLSSNTSYYWKVIVKDNSNSYFSSSTWSFTTSPGVMLSLKFIQEGLYSSIFNLLFRSDSVKVFLRHVTSPYSIVDSAAIRIDSVNFTGSLAFPDAVTGTYYIVVKHLNSLETWSKAGGQYMKFDSLINFDFTLSSSQAYGNNLKLRGSKYCAYAGDVDQNGFIDGDDLSIIDNEAYYFVTGNHLPADLNGDNIVDGIDFLIGDNNWQYIIVKSPLNTSDAGFKFRVKKFIEP